MAWILSGFADEAGETSDEQIGALEEADVRHVDLRNLDGFNIVDLPLDHAERVKKKLDAAGIKVCMYGSPIGKIDIGDDFAIDEKRLEHLGRLRTVFGATAVRIFSYYNKANAPVEQWQAEAVRRVSRLAERAERYGLYLYHEHEPGLFGGNFERVETLRQQVQSEAGDRFRLIFDFDNYNQAGEDVWENYTRQKPWVRAIHLKESQRQPDGSFMHVPVGQGDGQIARILGDLAASGWEGSLTLEPHLARSPAVLKTGPHGLANKSLASLTHRECFVVAARAAQDLLHQVGKL
jgi:sugar phosphate isomerase/epimerase